MAQIKVH